MRVASLPKLWYGLLALMPALAEAHAGYTGYSGAPGTYGLCASSCHGSGTGTITVSGFPAQYNPGQQYEIVITSPSPVKNFNGSIRQGTGSTNAGVISTGTGTATYNVPVETNGVHLSTADQTSFSFFWTAPPAGTGEVRLYLALHWGLASGPNLDTVLVSTENVGIGETGSGLPEYLLPTQTSGVFLLRLKPADTYRTVLVYDLYGMASLSLLVPPQESEVLVDLRAEPSGIYFVKTKGGPTFTVIRK